MTAARSAVSMKTVYHADLRDADSGEDYWLQACGRRYLLVPHTEQTRAAAKAANATLAATPDNCLTHYTQDAVDLPADRVVRVHIKHTLRNQPHAKGNAGVGHVAIHVPPSAALTGAYATAETAVHAQIHWLTTAQGLVLHHADLLNVDPTISATIQNYMNNDQAIVDQFQTLVQIMEEMGPPTEQGGWAKLVPFTPPASELKGCDGTTTYYLHQPSPDIIAAAGPVTTAMMIATKNDMSLQGKKWTLQPGTSVQDADEGEQHMRRAARVDASLDADWHAALGSTDTAFGLQASIEVLDSASRQIKLTMQNTYIRYLGAYIRFFDANGEAMHLPEWTIDNPGTVYTLMRNQNIDYDDMRWLGYISPVNNLFAVPITSDPGVLEVDLTFPEGAVSATIYGSGLGTGSDTWPRSPLVGGLLTGLLNFGVPAFTLATATSIQAFKPLYKLADEVMSDNDVLTLLFVTGVTYFGDKFGEAAVHKEMDWHALESLGKLLFSPGLTKLLAWVETKIAVEAVADEIPFAGWVTAAINIATDVIQVAETITEVATSPWNITNTIATSITTTVHMHPDPRNKAFPQGDDATLVVKMIYQSQSRPTVTKSIPVPSSPPIPLSIQFTNNTLGGQVKFEADYYIGTWLAGKATSGVMNNDEDDVTDIEMYLVEFPVPLTDKSVYVHHSLLTYQNGAYVWQDTGTAPTATAANADTSSTGNAISIWSGLTLSQRHGMIGSAWKAAGMGVTSCSTGQGGQLFALQNVNIPGTAMSDPQFPSCGLDGQTLLVYDPYPPKFLMKDGNWVLQNGKPQPDPSDRPLGEYYVDPRKAGNDPYKDGGFHLRKVTLSPPTPFNMSNSQLSYGRFQYQPDSIALHPSGHTIAINTQQLSYGRFQYQPDSIALHPSGHTIAINTQYAKIQIGQLVLAGAADAEVPMARVYAGRATVADRPGLLFSPVAVTCAYDGTVLVLEDTNSSAQNDGVVLARVQAFDLNGNPVSRFFDDKGRPTPFLNLSTTGDNTYLDICAVGSQQMTYMYVLYYTGDGFKASDYHMAIYQYGKSAPSGNPLVVTDNLAAARLSVDMWHTLYALNYAMVTDGNGNPAGPKNATTGPAGRTVPSVSEWVPPIPQ